MENNKLVFKTETLEVICQENNVRLNISCTGPFTTEDFKNSLLHALKCAEEHNIKQWLLDFGVVGQLDEEQEAWVFTQFFPQIMITLGSNNFVAMLLSEKCYQYLIEEVGKLGLMSFNSFVKFNNFCDLNEALAWLNENEAQPVQS